MPTTIHLNQNRDFQTLYRRGKKIVAPWLIMYVRPNHQGINRLGLTTGKRVGKAVARTRARRVIRAAYRACESSLPTGMDIVVVALPSINGIKSTTIARYFSSTGRLRLEQAMQATNKPKKGGIKS